MQGLACIGSHFDALEDRFSLLLAPKGVRITKRRIQHTGLSKEVEYVTIHYYTASNSSERTQVVISTSSSFPYFSRLLHCLEYLPKTHVKLVTATLITPIRSGKENRHLPLGQCSVASFRFIRSSSSLVQCSAAIILLLLLVPA